MRNALIYLALAAIGVTTFATLRAQSPAGTPAFEVASVKPNTSATEPGTTSDTTPGRFTIVNTPLRFIILYAYQLLDHQLFGAPDWTFDNRFNIVATYEPASVPTTRQDVRFMVQKLLADRFGLTVHRDKRNLPMYALTVARKDGRLGPQLLRSDIDCEQWLADKRPQVGAGGPSPVAAGGKRPACLMSATRQWLSGGTRTMANLAASLQSLTGRPVVDKTGLVGTFDMDMKWTNSPADVAASRNGDASTPGDGASIFTALQEQLGLKLESGRELFDVLVIDHVEQPTPD